MKKLILINAIVWAIVILVTSYLFKESPNWMYGFGTIIVAATIMNSLIYSASRKEAKANCIK